jgi:hypothetical protein
LSGPKASALSLTARRKARILSNAASLEVGMRVREKDVQRGLRAVFEACTANSELKVGDAMRDALNNVRPALRLRDEVMLERALRATEPRTELHPRFCDPER